MPSKPAAKKSPSKKTTASAAKAVATQKKKTTSKPKTSASTSQQTASSAQPISPAERMKMIAEAAYYMAANRGFAHGNEVDDWVAAEQQIDATLKSTASTSRRKLK